MDSVIVDKLLVVGNIGIVLEINRSFLWFL